MKLDVPLDIPKDAAFPECKDKSQLKRWLWRHIQIPQLLYLITTRNADGTSNCEANNRGLPFGSLPAQRFAFVCWRAHHTAQNVLRDREFVVNIPGAGILEQALQTARPYEMGIDEVTESGLTPLPARTVSPPRIEECALHIECKLDWHKEIGDAGMILLCGRIVAASGDRQALTGDVETKMRHTRPFFVMPRGIDTEAMRLTGTGATVGEIGRVRQVK